MAYAEGRGCACVPGHLNQTGVLFSGVLEGTIAFRYGPFHNRNCRLEETRDMDDLRLSEAPFFNVGR